MSNTPAFPLNTPKWHESVSDAGFEDIDFTMGMTLRDYFAAKALQSLITNFLNKDLDQTDPYGWMGGLAMDSYSMADAMMKARDE
jgi:hypothetical protein